MTAKQFISFISGLFVTAFIYALLIIAFAFGTLSFSGQTLNQKEGTDAFFFYSAVIVIVATFFFIYKRFKTNRKFSASGIAVSLMFAFYVLFITGKVYSDNLDYHQPFDTTKWKIAEFKPFKMAKTVTKSNFFIGQTKQQVIDKLGVTNDSLKNEKIDYLKYHTDKGSWELRIYFNDNRVTEAYLFEEGLSI